jgi:hypothetical protein
MTTPTITEIRRTGNPVGERTELARYTIPSGERVLYGQRVNGVVRVIDVPAGGGGRAYLVEESSSKTAMTRSGHSWPTTWSRLDCSTTCLWPSRRSPAFAARTEKVAGDDPQGAPAGGGLL